MGKSIMEYHLYENDNYLVIPETGSGDDCEWEYYDGGYLCGKTFMYAILDKNEFDSDNQEMLHIGHLCIGHLCDKHIQDAWALLIGSN
jgi:hypothetical protein